MARNSASSPRRRLGLVSAGGVWLAVVALTHGALCAELGDALQRTEDNIELRLRPPPPPTLREAPTRSSEPEPIEPWELVGV